MIIGDRYFWDNPESGWYEVSKNEHDRLQMWRDYLNEMMKSFINPDSKTVGGIILVITRPFGDFNDDLEDIWEGSKENPIPGQLYKYFTPTDIESQTDKYGHAILPPRLGKNTDDSISAARLSFPKTEDEAFGDT